MQIIGAELLGTRTGAETLKFILNERVMMLFYPTNQHRDIRMDGAFYEDESKGNAVAGLIFPDHIEIRLHREFSCDRIRSLWADALKQCPPLEGLPVRYGATQL